MAADYYAALGVSRTASKDEIRKAYKKLVRQYHPDVKPDDKVAEARFKEIQEAWAVLGDEKKRQQYDRFGRTFDARGGPGGGPSPGGNPFGGAGFDLDDILGGIFGGGQSPFGGGGRQQRPRASHGEHIRAEVTIPFELAVRGGEHTVTVSRGGETERLAVQIPAGTDDGTVLRLTGKGHPGQYGGKPGNLLITVRVASHPWFRREGDNLIVEVPVTPAEAVLGAKVTVPTLDEGNLRLTIPPGTSSGARLRLRGKGVKNARAGKTGDELVVVRIVVPEKPTSAKKKLYKQLADLDSSPRDGLWP